MNEKFIKLLKRQLKEIDNIGMNPVTNSERSFGIEAWKSSTISILERIFGQESKKIKEIEKIQLGSTVRSKGPIEYHVESVKETGKAIINACISELEILGRPDQIYNGNKQGINLTVSQSQKNNQTIKLEIIVNELKKELTGSQLEEIQSILTSNEKVEEKKRKTYEKLKEFGINTISNIVAGILTNPSIIG